MTLLPPIYGRRMLCNHDIDCAKDEERRSSREYTIRVEYAALKAAREMAAKSTGVTIERVTRVLRSERRNEKPHGPSSTRDKVSAR